MLACKGGRRRVGAAFGLVMAVLPVATRAQDEVPVLTGPAVLARLRAHDLTLDEAATLVPLLVSQPITLRLQATSALGLAYLERGRQHSKACQTLGKSLAKVVVTLQKDQLGKTGLVTVGELRGKALAISSREGLTKASIHEDIDPLLAQLEALLWPTAERIAAADPTLRPAMDSLRQARAQLVKAYSLYGESTIGLELHPDAEKHFAKSPPPPPPAPVVALDDEYTVWTLLAMPLSARDRRPLENNELLRATTDPEEFAGTTALNRLRYLLGLSLLRLDDKLTLAARDHSSDMATLGFFAHSSPIAGKKSPGDRAARFGTSAGAENIAAGHATGAGAIRGWWYSPGHHRNMLGGHARVGLGRSGELWTQMFGG